MDLEGEIMSQDKAIFKNINAHPQERQTVNRPQHRQTINKAPKRQNKKEVLKNEVNDKASVLQKIKKDESDKITPVQKKDSSFKLDFNNKSVLSGVIFSELLGKPKSLRKK